MSDANKKPTQPHSKKLDLHLDIGGARVAFAALAVVVLHLFLFFFVVSAARAEYRAYELKIDNTETNKSRSEISTLDNYQYPRYYPLNKSETVSYVDSWMCRENTSHFKKICAKPDRAPASSTGAKPNTSPDVGSNSKKLDSASH